MGLDGRSSFLMVALVIVPRAGKPVRSTYDQAPRLRRLEALP